MQKVDRTSDASVLEAIAMIEALPPRWILASEQSGASLWQQCRRALRRIFLMPK